jgi:hypothetical protein
MKKLKPNLKYNFQPNDNLKMQMVHLEELLDFRKAINFSELENKRIIHLKSKSKSKNRKASVKHVVFEDPNKTDSLSSMP